MLLNRPNWGNKYPQEIRKVIYTTNLIESFHSQLRKVTKTKRVFHSDQSLLKLLYLVFHNTRVGWAAPIKGWKLMHAQMSIIFEYRLTISSN
jgi:putative transposase